VKKKKGGIQVQNQKWKKIDNENCTQINLVDEQSDVFINNVNMNGKAT
jgi:LEA14-like dessication related protein